MPSLIRCRKDTDDPISEGCSVDSALAKILASPYIHLTESIEPYLLKFLMDSEDDAWTTSYTDRLAPRYFLFRVEREEPKDRLSATERLYRYPTVVNALVDTLDAKFRKSKTEHSWQLPIYNNTPHSERVDPHEPYDLIDTVDDNVMKSITEQNFPKKLSRRTLRPDPKCEPLRTDVLCGEPV